MQINCPACHRVFVVPGTVAPAATRAPAAAPPPVPAPLQAAPTSSACPSCGAVLGRGTVLCTHCGYNLVTRQRVAAGRPAAPGKPGAPQHGAAWYKTPYPYVGALAVILGALYYFGQGNPVLMLAFLGVAALYTLGVHIVVVVVAFKDGIGTGFLTLCIPFYALYFVFKVHENDTLKVLYAVAILINIILRFINLS